MTEEEIIKESFSSLKEFFDQFGEDDIYKQIFLEELFKVIHEEIISCHR